MKDTFGRTYTEPFAFYNRVSQSLKMWQGIDHPVSPTYSETVPKTGLLSDGFLYELPMPAHHTGEKGCSSLLPTPLARDHKGRSFDPEDLSRLPNAMLKLLPTPKATDCQGSGTHGDGGKDLRTCMASLGESTNPQSEDGNTQLGLFQIPLSQTKTVGPGSPQFSLSG